MASVRSAAARIRNTWITTTKPEKYAEFSASIATEGSGNFSDNTERLSNAIEYLEEGVAARIDASGLAARARDRARVLRKVA